MIRELNSYSVPLTPELAKEFASLPRWHGERGIRVGRRAVLERALEDGTFHSPTWAVAYLNGNKFRMDGQCSSTVLSESNGHFPKNLKSHVTEFSVDTELELAQLFSQFDNPRSVRTASEVTGAHAAIHAELRDMSKRKIACCVSGIAVALSEAGGEHRGGKASSEERAKLVHDYKDFIVWASEFSGQRILERSSVMAAIFKTWKLNGEAAADFWRLVDGNSHPDSLNPTRRLHELLKEVSFRIKLESATNRSAKWGHRAILVKCIHAWNAWRRGMHTDLKYYADSPVPELV